MTDGGGRSAFSYMVSDLRAASNPRGETLRVSGCECIEHSGGIIFAIRSIVLDQDPFTIDTILQMSRDQAGDKPRTLRVRDLHGTSGPRVYRTLGRNNLRNQFNYTGTRSLCNGDHLTDES